MSAHAFLAPSSAHLWAPPNGCRGSARMQAQYPDPEESPEAREGTAAHYYATEYLLGRTHPVGTLAPNGAPITQEMVDCAEPFIVDVLDTYKGCEAPAFYVEQRFAMPIIHAENWGTPDVAIVDMARRVLHLWDYKFGHRFVDAAGNWQMLDYAVGVMQALVPTRAEWPQWTITLTVVQPRSFHPLGPVREWRVDGRALLDEWVPAFYEAAKEATQPDAPMRTGAFCVDCSARHVCPAAQQAAAVAIDVSLKSAPVELTPHAIGLELRMLDDAAKRLKARKTGLEEQALSLIRGGTGVPFFTTEYAIGREKWTCTAAEVAAVGEIMGVAGLLKEPEAITPGQARTAFKKAGVDDSVINAYADKPRGALRLTRVDDDAAKLAFS